MKCECGNKARKICDIVTEQREEFHVLKFEETELFQCIKCGRVFTFEQGIIGN